MDHENKLVSTRDHIVYGIHTANGNVQHVLRAFNRSMCGVSLFELSRAPTPVRFLCMKCRGLAESAFYVDLVLVQ